MCKKTISEPDPLAPFFLSSVIVAQVKTAVDFQKKALMIGIRYASVRVQGTLEEDGPAAGRLEETAILDYPLHMNKLLTLLAAAYAWHFQASYVLKLNDALEEGTCRPTAGRI